MDKYNQPEYEPNHLRDTLLFATVGYKPGYVDLLEAAVHAMNLTGIGDWSEFERNPPTIHYHESPRDYEISWEMFEIVYELARLHGRERDINQLQIKGSTLPNGRRFVMAAYSRK